MKSLSKRNIAIIALILSVINSAILGINVYLTHFTPKEPKLTIHDFPEKIGGSLGGSLNCSFIVYNEGSKTCFIEFIWAYEVLENGKLEGWIVERVIPDFSFTLEAGEHRKVTVILPSPTMVTTKKFRIMVFYETEKVLASPVATAEWNEVKVELVSSG